MPSLMEALIHQGRFVSFYCAIQKYEKLYLRWASIRLTLRQLRMSVVVHLIPVSHGVRKNPVQLWLSKDIYFMNWALHKVHESIILSNLTLHLHTLLASLLAYIRVLWRYLHALFTSTALHVTVLLCTVCSVTIQCIEVVSSVTFHQMLVMSLHKVTIITMHCGHAITFPNVKICAPKQPSLNVLLCRREQKLNLCENNFFFFFLLFFFQ